MVATLDKSTERIVFYLSERDIPINVLYFQVFTNGAEQLLSRAWLLDPVRTQVITATASDGASEPWLAGQQYDSSESEQRSSQFALFDVSYNGGNVVLASPFVGLTHQTFTRTLGAILAFKNAGDLLLGSHFR